MQCNFPQYRYFLNRHGAWRAWKGPVAFQIETRLVTPSGPCADLKQEYRKGSPETAVCQGRQWNDACSSLAGAASRAPQPEQEND
jgi:hypothetical protein